jgi:hypothetical protein
MMYPGTDCLTNILSLFIPIIIYGRVK